MGENAINHFFVYILSCRHQMFYTGCTNHLSRRFQEHVEGTSKCKFTRSFRPIEIAQFWQIEQGKSTALKIEKWIKKLSKHKKGELILHPELLNQFSKVMD